jgi:hypothetical protein
MTMTIIARCRYQSDVDKQIRILHTINSALPKSLRLQMPSLLTNDYVSRALDIIEDRILPHVDITTNTILASHYKKWYKQNLSSGLPYIAESPIYSS